MIVKATPEPLLRELAGPAGPIKDRDEDAGQGGLRSEFAELMSGTDHNERLDKPGRESEGKRSKERDAVTPINKKSQAKAKAPTRKASKPAADSDTDDGSKKAAVSQTFGMNAPAPKASSGASSGASDIEASDDASLAIDAASATSANGSAEALPQNGWATSNTENPSAEPSLETPTEIPQSGPAGERESAMNDFLVKMQDKFGIAPEKVVEAFSKMSAEALNAPPEESAKDFLALLDLPATDLPVAQDMYSQMLNETGRADLEEKLDIIDETLGALDDSLAEVGEYELDSVMEQLTPAERALASLDLAAVSVIGPNTDFNTELAAAIDADPVTAQRAADDMLARLNQLMKKDVTALPTPDADSEFASKFASDVAIGLPLDREALADADADAKVNDVDPMATAMTADGIESSSEPDTDSETPNFEQEKKETSATVKKSAKAEPKSSEFKSDALKLADAMPTDPGMQTPNAAPVPSGKTATVASVTGEQISDADEAAQMKQILNQARLTISKGGGEVEMAMNSEGLGRVKLKIAVNEGQVDIQMIAENDNAKKLLEKGLGELKSSLAEHQLKVENLRVDVGSDIKKEMDQGQDQSRNQSRNQSHDQQREQSRQFAQDFLGRFRDERNGFRQGLMNGNSSRKAYGGAVATEAAPLVSRANTGAGAMKRLNVVA